MATNTCAFLATTLSRFQHAGIQLWVCGGWAEELWQMIPPRLHHDIDLLYPAPSFQTLDHVLGTQAGFIDIPMKRFSHKRAIMYHGVMLEFLLVHGAVPNFVTTFFDDRYQFHWPADTFDHALRVDHHTIAVASRAALTQYRQHHAAITHAYSAALEASEAEQRRVH